MNSYLFALLIHDQSEPFESLKDILRDLSVETYSVSSLHDAERLLPQTQPHVVFTAALLPDGSWSQAMKLAEQASVPINVIVVGRHKDLKLYLSTVARGAFDCIVPPFDPQALDYIVWAAGEDVRHRRRALTRASAA